MSGKNIGHLGKHSFTVLFAQFPEDCVLTCANNQVTVQNVSKVLCPFLKLLYSNGLSGSLFHSI